MATGDQGDRRQTPDDERFDADAFWRDHPHLIRQIHGPHARTANRMPFRRPIDAEELTHLIHEGELIEEPELPTGPVAPELPSVVDVRGHALPDRARPAPAVEAEPEAKVIDLRPQLPRRTPGANRHDALMETTAGTVGDAAWLDDFLEEHLSGAAVFEEGSTRLGRGIKRSWRRNPGDPEQS